MNMIKPILHFLGIYTVSDMHGLIDSSYAEVNRIRTESNEINASYDNILRNRILENYELATPNVHIYSMLKDAWRNDPDLIKYHFPITAISRDNVVWHEHISGYVLDRLIDMGCMNHK